MADNLARDFMGRDLMPPIGRQPVRDFLGRRVSAPQGIDYVGRPVDGPLPAQLPTIGEDDG